VVSEPDTGTTVNAVIAYLLFNGVSLGEVMEARVTLEQIVAELAATRADDLQIALLRAQVERETPDQIDGTDRHHILHTMIAQTAANPAAELFVEILGRLTVQWVYPAVSKRRRYEALSASHAAHRALVDAIAGGDQVRCQHIMRRHLDGMARWIDEHPGEPQLTPWAPIGGVPKLGEQLAHSIAVDIVAGRKMPGNVIGSEAELIEQYGLSRSAFREGVRLLEFQRLATMRHGVGGLVVTSPNVSAIVDAAAVYLEFRHITADDLMEMRRGLELRAIELAARRLTADDASMLQGILEEELATDYSAPAGGRLHQVLAGLSGNRALTLFIHVLARLTMNFAEQPSPTTSRFAELARSTHQAHQAIVDALVAGDGQLARRRLGKHLDALGPLMH